MRRYSSFLVLILFFACAVLASPILTSHARLEKGAPPAKITAHSPALVSHARPKKGALPAKSTAPSSKAVGNKGSKAKPSCHSKRSPSLKPNNAIEKVLLDLKCGGSVLAEEQHPEYVDHGTQAEVYNVPGGRFEGSSDAIIKIIKPGFGGGGEEEARNLYTVGHLLAWGRHSAIEGKPVYLVMKRIPGSTAQKAIADGMDPKSAEGAHGSVMAAIETYKKVFKMDKEHTDPGGKNVLFHKDNAGKWVADLVDWAGSKMWVGAGEQPRIPDKMTMIVRDEVWDFNQKKGSPNRSCPCILM